MNNDFRGFLDQLKELEAMEQKELTVLASETHTCEELERQLSEEKEKFEFLQLKHSKVAKKNAMKYHQGLELNDGIKGLQKELGKECMILVETRSRLVETKALLESEKLVYDTQLHQMEEHKRRLHSYHETLALKAQDQLEKERQIEAAMRPKPPVAKQPKGNRGRAAPGSVWRSGTQQIEETLSKLGQEKLQLAQRVKDVESVNTQLKKEIDSMERQIKSLVDAIFGGVEA